MDNPGPLENFKNKLCEVVPSIPPDLPIVASIGKQSRGKSFLCKKVFNKPIPTKDGKLITKGTEILYNEVFENFMLLDMEGFETQSDDVERDVFNFCSIQTLSDIILLHVTQDDLENQTFLETFSFAFWQSSRTTKKYRDSLPEIILLIRDPRW